MAGTTLQQSVNHQSLNFHHPCNVQVGEHNIQNQLTNQLQEDNDRMKDEIQQLQLDKQSLADEIQKLQSDRQRQADEIEKLKSRVEVLEDKTDMITLDIYHGFGSYAITICVSRCSSVSEVERVVQKEIKRKYGNDVDGHIECICGLVNRGSILYQCKNDRHRPLKHFGVQCGDEALWHC